MENPEIAYGDKWFQRILTYAGLPAGILFLIFNLNYLALICFLWLVSAGGYVFIKWSRRQVPIDLNLTQEQAEHGKETRSADGGIKDFVALARILWPILNENKRAFRDFSPRSGANSAAPIDWDLGLWERAKKEILGENNRKIAELINDNYNLVPNEFRAIFDKEKSHIFAFEKHLDDPRFDYSDHQFPQDFASLIDTTCVEIAKDAPILEGIIGWLTKESLAQVAANDSFLMGSILRGEFTDSDVDLVLLVPDTTPEEIRSTAKKLDAIKKAFEKEFDRRLHILVFSEPETDSFYSFRESVDLIKQLI